MANTFMKGRKYPLKEQVSDLKALLRNRDAFNETLEAKIEKLTHGGSRAGAGAKKKKKSEKKEPTVVMRIPKSKVGLVLKAIGKA